MGQPLGSEQKAMHRIVSEVLHYIWDPIGIAGSVGARDEYDGYADHVFSLLWHGTDASSIAQYLVKVAGERMGLSGTEWRASLAADKLVEWRAELLRIPPNNSFKPNPLRGSA
ncbi:hypothetical protein NYR97_06130 [Xanthomonas hydrangeae]|uniref:Uncharacterized protein n=1 Tax=Xanthomonas hydrangeae TaxID=2775159 RepID=A0AAU0BFU7_9XANT|nr:hypothetical protein [Xanthomonas hydrangeae]WOB50958.1 hypothetical protein NYR97_06130 [Xanthomonas hydrangeae]